MSAAHSAASAHARPRRTGSRIDNRLSYLSFGIAWLVGHGAAALAHGDDPLVAMPDALPGTLLAAGLTAAIAITATVVSRAQRDAPAAAAAAGRMLTSRGWSGSAHCSWRSPHSPTYSTSPTSTR
jgi:hypothetical protein